MSANFAALFPHPLLAAIALLLGLAVSPFLVAYAAERTLTRNLSFALEDETTLLAGVLGDLRRYPYLNTLSTTDFAAGTHSRIWTGLLSALGEDAHVPAGATEEECAQRGAALEARRPEILAALAHALTASPAPETDSNRVGELLALAGAKNLTATGDETLRASADEKVVAAAENVLAAGQDRNRLSGAGLVLPTSTPDSTDPKQPPLARVKVTPTPRRHVATAALTGLAGALIPGALTSAGYSGIAAALATLSLAALLVMSVLVSLVDIDTLYIDTPVWAIGTTGSWLAAIGATLTGGHPGHLIAGIVCVVAVVILFEGTNLLFRLVRGIDGQGFGDTLIIVATVGAPAALTGAMTVGYYSVVAGAVAGALGWFAGRLAGRVTRHTPFAFGPWLAAGWVLALIWHTLATAWLI